MRLTTLTLFFTLLLAACGPRVLIDPLIGDDPEVLRHVVTSVPDLSEYPPVVAANSLYQALVSGDAESVWAFLSRETRAALDQHAVEQGLAADGRALIELSFATGFPTIGPEGALLRVSPRAWFVIDDLSHFRTSLTPTRSVPRPGERVKLYAVDSAERYREMTLVREEERWRVHRPTLRLENHLFRTL